MKMNQIQMVNIIFKQTSTSSKFTTRMLKQSLSNEQKNLTTKHRSHQSKPDSSGYTICGAGLAALAKMVFERIAGLPFLQSTRVRFLIINRCSFIGFHFFTPAKSIMTISLSVENEN